MGSGLAPSKATRFAIFVVLVITVATLRAPAVTAGESVAFCFNSWPPYARMKAGRPEGISVAILREAARRAKLAARFRELPWKRCLQSVRVGKIDAVIDAAKRKEFVQGPTSFSFYSNTIWVRQGDPLRTPSLDALKGRKLGLVHGYVYPKPIAEAKGVRREYAVDDAANIRKLAFGRVDAIIGDLMNTWAVARKSKLALTPLQPPLSVDRLYVSFNKKRATLQKRIDKQLAAMFDDGFVDRVYVQHVGRSYRELEAAAFRKPDQKPGG